MVFSHDEKDLECDKGVFSFSFLIVNRVSLFTFFREYRTEVLSIYDRTVSYIVSMSHPSYHRLIYSILVFHIYQQLKPLPECQKRLQEVQKKCTSCQQYTNLPSRIICSIVQ